MSSHYHAEVSMPACMPEYFQIHATAREAVEDIKALIQDEDWQVKILTDPFLAVFKYSGKPSLLNVFVTECDDNSHMEGGDEQNDTEAT